VTISSWLNFGHLAPPGRGLWQGENFWLCLTAASVQCLRLLWVLFFIACFHCRCRLQLLFVFSWCPTRTFSLTCVCPCALCMCAESRFVLWTERRQEGICCSMLRVGTRWITGWLYKNIRLRNFGLTANLRKFFNWWQTLSLIFSLRQQFGLRSKSDQRSCLRPHLIGTIQS